MDEPIPPEALLAGYPAGIAAIGERLRQVVREARPDVIERVRAGWRIIGYDVPRDRRRTAYFAWIMPERVHIHLGFVAGVAMDDPAGLLEGMKGVKLARWTTFKPGDPIDPAPLARLVREGADVALLSRSERLWRMLERTSGDDPLPTVRTSPRQGSRRP